MNYPASQRWWRDATAGLRLAAGTLTMIPVGDVGTITPRVAGAAMTLAGLAGVPLAALAAGVVAAGTALHLPALVTAALVVGALAAGSRAMHLDGLADTVDGIGAGWDRERALRVMHTGDVGPMGVAALVVTLAVQIAALASAMTVSGHGWLVAGVAVVISRSVCAAMCVRGMPAAAANGLGAAVAGSVPPVVAVAVFVVNAVLAAGVSHMVEMSPQHAVAAVLVAWAGVGLLMAKARRTFGGVSGDVMGAGIEVAFALTLMTFSVGTT